MKKYITFFILFTSLDTFAQGRPGCCSNGTLKPAEESYRDLMQNINLSFHECSKAPGPVPKRPYFLDIVSVAKYFSNKELSNSLKKFENAGTKTCQDEFQEKSKDIQSCVFSQGDLSFVNQIEDDPEYDQKIKTLLNEKFNHKLQDGDVKSILDYLKKLHTTPQTYHSDPS